MWVSLRRARILDGLPERQRALANGRLLATPVSSRLSLGIFAVEMIALYPLFFQRLASAWDAAS